MASNPQLTRALYADLSCAPQKTRAELLGLVEGILADGAIVEAEASFLRRWITENEAIRSTWPANVLFTRIAEMLADGALDAGEQRELFETMQQFVQCRELAKMHRAPVEALATKSTATVSTPFDDPEPEIVHAGRAFVVTGDFACAPRKQVEQRITQLGGSVVGTVSKKVHFLIVGSLGSELYKGGSWGTKIERAVELRREGVGLRVVREEHWHRAAQR